MIIPTIRVLEDLDKVLDTGENMPLAETLEFIRYFPNTSG
jgi:hypothetical protein